MGDAVAGHPLAKLPSLQMKQLVEEEKTLLIFCFLAFADEGGFVLVTVHKTQCSDEIGLLSEAEEAD